MDRVGVFWMRRAKGESGVEQPTKPTRAYTSCRARLFPAGGRAKVARGIHAPADRAEGGAHLMGRAGTRSAGVLTCALKAEHANRGVPRV